MMRIDTTPLAAEAIIKWKKDKVMNALFHYYMAIDPIGNSNGDIDKMVEQALVAIDAIHQGHVLIKGTVVTP
jgi:hypothetical protein